MIGLARMSCGEVRRQQTQQLKAAAVVSACCTRPERAVAVLRVVVVRAAVA